MLQVSFPFSTGSHKRDSNRDWKHPTRYTVDNINYINILTA